MSLEIKPLTPEHAPDVSMPPVMGFKDPGAWQAFLRLTTGAGHAWTLEGPEGVAAIGGVAGQWRGVAEVWLVPTELTPKYPMAMVRRIRTHLEECAYRMGLWRLQGVVQADLAGHLRWASLLGFCREGVMTCYGPDKRDFMRIARLF